VDCETGQRQRHNVVIKGRRERYFANGPLVTQPPPGPAGT
jgi:hypothetical protein